VDVGSAARSLIGKVDVIYTNTDNNVVSAYESLVKVGQDLGSESTLARSVHDLISVVLSLALK
jgi:ABC-type uncharacterized transport system substrate-binding protein